MQNALKAKPQIFPREGKIRRIWNIFFGSIEKKKVFKIIKLHWSTEIKKKKSYFQYYGNSVID